MPLKHEIAAVALLEMAVMEAISLHHLYQSGNGLL